MNHQFSLLKPSPMAVGDVFAGAFNVFKKKWSSFVGIALVTMALGVGVVIAMVAMVAASMVPMFRGGEPSAGGIVGLIVAVVVGYALILAVSVKGQILMIAAAREAAADGNPTFGSTWRDTKGTLRQVVMGGLVILAIGLVAYLAFAAVIFLIVRSVAENGSDAAGLIGLVVLLVPVFYVAMVYISVKLTFTFQAVTLEGSSLFEGMKRSWNLTKGHWWRIFGNFLLLGLAIQIPSFIFSGLTQTMVPSDSSGEPQFTVLGLIGLLLMLVYSFCAYIVQVIFTTALYIDAVQRQGQLVPMPESLAHLGAGASWAGIGHGGAPGWGEQAQWQQAQGWDQPQGWGQDQSWNNQGQGWNQDQSWNQDQNWNQGQASPQGQSWDQSQNWQSPGVDPHQGWQQPGNSWDQQGQNQPGIQPSANPWANPTPPGPETPPQGDTWRQQ